MKIYISTMFTGHYPVGTAALVVARDGARANHILNEALKQDGLPGDNREEWLHEVPVEDELVDILNNGNY
jgi:hypothetical protein